MESLWAMLSTVLCVEGTLALQTHYCVQLSVGESRIQTQVLTLHSKCFPYSPRHHCEPHTEFTVLHYNLGQGTA